MKPSEVWIICPFGARVVSAGTEASFYFQATRDLHPPYRFVLHGDVRPFLCVRKMLFDGKGCFGSDVEQLYGQGLLAASGDAFGPLLLPFWGPPCPVGRRVEVELINTSAVTMWVAATLFASFASVEAEAEAETVVSRSKNVDPNYWR